MNVSNNTFWVDLTFDNSATFETGFIETNTMFDAGFSEITKVTTSDHRELTHRDALEQHPIESITYLTDELDIRPDEYLTNIDIYEILQH